MVFHSTYLKKLKAHLWFCLVYIYEEKCVAVGYGDFLLILLDITFQFKFAQIRFVLVGVLYFLSKF